MNCAPRGYCTTSMRDEVKIDASFVRKLGESADDERIVRSIIDLVRSLGLQGRGRRGGIG